MDPCCKRRRAGRGGYQDAGKDHQAWRVPTTALGGCLISSSSKAVWRRAAEGCCMEAVEGTGWIDVGLDPR